MFRTLSVCERFESIIIARKAWRSCSWKAVPAQGTGVAEGPSLTSLNKQNSATHRQQIIDSEILGPRKDRDRYHLWLSCLVEH